MKTNDSYFYDISINGVSQPEIFEKSAKRVINEISQTVGWDNHTRISLEPVSTKKHMFSLLIQSEIDGQPIIVRKQGKRIDSLLNKAKKSAIQCARDIQFKNIRRRKVPSQGRFTVSLLGEAS